MHREDVQDLLDRRTSLLDAIDAGLSLRDRRSIDAELVEVAEALKGLGGLDATD